MDRILFRMWRLFRRPPSRTKLIFMLAALGISIGVVIVERTVGLPDWMKVERVHRPHLPRL